LKTFALLQKNAAFNAAAVDAAETLRLGRGDASGLLRSSAIREGDSADFLLVRADLPELAMGELDAALVYAASGAVVDTTVVAGRVLMSGGVVEGVGEAVRRAKECASEIGVG
jgi:cytosine/adenosine deaminase-related metal-dependent hydrolase